ncbi:hypothetical protein [Paenibacillus sp. GYB003]
MLRKLLEQLFSQEKKRRPIVGIINQDEADEMRKRIEAELKMQEEIAGKP